MPSLETKNNLANLATKKDGVTLVKMRETVGLLFSPATDYAETSPRARRWEDLQAAVGIPVDLALAGWICRIAPGPERVGFEVTVTRPPADGIPIVTAKASADTWCDALAEVSYALHERMDRIEAQQERVSQLQEVA